MRVSDISRHPDRNPFRLHEQILQHTATATPWSRTKFELELTIKSNMAATAQTHRIPQEFNRSKIETALDDREIQIGLLESGFVGDAQLRQVEHLDKQRQLVKRCRGDP